MPPPAGAALPWHWLRARYYDPALRRFLEPDPSSRDGVRSYAYCHNAPADCADPSGLAGGLPSTEGDRIDGPVGGLGAGAASEGSVPVVGLSYDPTRLLPAPEGPAGLLAPPENTLEGTSLTRTGQYRLPLAETSVQRVGSGSILYGDLDAFGRSTTVEATITDDLINKGTEATIDPPGYEGEASGHARGHLLAKQLGGLGDEERNIVTLYQDMNNSQMKTVENSVRRAVESGQSVQYRVESIYRPWGSRAR